LPIFEKLDELPADPAMSNKITDQRAKDHSEEDVVFGPFLLEESPTMVATAIQAVPEEGAIWESHQSAHSGWRVMIDRIGPRLIRADVLYPRGKAGNPVNFSSEQFTRDFHIIRPAPTEDSTVRTCRLCGMLKPLDDFRMGSQKAGVRFRYKTCATCQDKVKADGIRAAYAAKLKAKQEREAAALKPALRPETIAQYGLDQPDVDVAALDLPLVVVDAERTNGHTNGFAGFVDQDLPATVAPPEPRPDPTPEPTPAPTPTARHMATMLLELAAEAEHLQTPATFKMLASSVASCIEAGSTHAGVWIVPEELALALVVAHEAALLDLAEPAEVAAE
jgi:hypothetical protein